MVNRTIIKMIIEEPGGAEEGDITTKITITITITMEEEITNQEGNFH
jgi:hypothetical protein